jgi:cytochrome c peroxidase
MEVIHSTKKSTLYTKAFTLFILNASLFGCGESNNTNIQVVEATKTRLVIEKLNLTGDPSLNRDLPSIDDPKSQLGMLLFFTKGLGGDLDSACVSCHHPSLGGGDDLSLSVGVEANDHDTLGPGRLHNINGIHFDGGPTVPRNAPTTFNLAMWDKFLFHDGRVQSLGGSINQFGNDGLGIRTPDTAFNIADTNAGKTLASAQARFPVTSPEEMKGFYNFIGLDNTQVRNNLAQRIGGYGEPVGGLMPTNEWLIEFRKGFSSPQGSAEELITFSNIAEAIGEYENSQVFVETPWKQFIEGDDNAISITALRGAQLFFNSMQDGGANCASCHSGDFFTDESFHVLAVPQIGRGKGDGVYLDDDFGRFRETGLDEDKYKFRTPSLINTNVTGPWGHTGAYSSLESMIKHHFDPQLAIDNFDYSQLDPTIQATNMLENTTNAIEQLKRNRLSGVSKLSDMTLSDIQVNQLVEFINALTDPCVLDRACLSKWIPDASDPNPDSMRLNGKDINGDFL